MEIVKSTLCLLIFVICMQISESTWTAEGRIGMRFYTEDPTIYIEEPLEAGARILNNHHYNKGLPMVILIHGMDASVDCEFVESSVKAMYFRGINKAFNIIALNLPELMAIQSFYDKFLYRTAMNSQIAGDAIGNFLNDVISRKLISPDQIYVVGYSMGSQVAGYLARKVKEAHGLIHFIMGLDPAGMGFTPNTWLTWYSGLIHVTAADARFVHFMHCNSYGWGTEYHNATANFIFNGGNHQPGCTTSSNLGCSHNRVPFYFIEGILYPDKFLAQKCDSLVDFSNCHCTLKDVRPVTFPPDFRAMGTYYLRTNSETPFGQGEAGIECTENDETTGPITIETIKEHIVKEEKDVNSKEEQPRKKYVKKSNNNHHEVKHKNSSPGFQHRTMHKYHKTQKTLHKSSTKTKPHARHTNSHTATKESEFSLDDMVEKIHHIIVDK